MKERDKQMKSIFDQSFPTPSDEQTSATCERVFERLNNADVEYVEQKAVPWRSWPRLAPLRIAAAALVGIAVFAIPLVKTVLMPEGVYATAKLSEGMVYKMSEGKSRAMAVGEQITAGTVVRTDEKAAVLALADGARIEMQPMTELFLEQAKEGVKINLSDGSARVTPAKDPAVNLYLQSKEEVVPVIAEVFRSAMVGYQQTLSEPEIVFDTVSIRPSPPLATGVGNRGGPPGGGTPRGPSAGCPAAPFQIDPGRFIGNRITLAGLIGIAYGNRCLSQQVFIGGPDWIRTEVFDVQATIPAGTPPVTRAELREGKSPKLQKMFQNMLATRFKLVIRREIREMPVYNLVLTMPEKLVLAADPAVSAQRTANVRAVRPMFGVNNVTMAEFAAVLHGQIGRPVIDKTSAKDRYDFLMVLSDESPSPPPAPDAEFMAQFMNGMRDAIVSRLEDQLGLKLEPARALVEVLVVERAEKPSEN